MTWPPADVDEPGAEPTEVLWEELPTEQLHLKWTQEMTQPLALPAFRVPPYVRHLEPVSLDDDRRLTWPDIRRDMWR